MDISNIYWVANKYQQKNLRKRRKRPMNLWGGLKCLVGQGLSFTSR